MMSNYILITGIGGPAGKCAVRYFQEKGFPIIGTDIIEIETPGVDLFCKIPPAGHPSFSTALMDIIKKEKPSLLIPTVTEELPIVSKLKNTIEKHSCVVFISPINAIEIANDKLKTFRFMAEHGIPVPLFFNGDSPREYIIKELGFPLISKPYFGRGGKGVAIYRSYEELLNEMRQDIVYQEFIPGDEFDLNLFINRERKVMASVVLKKTALKNGIVGNALTVERAERDDIIDLGIEVAMLLEMEGPLNMDMRLRVDGTPVLLEINARLGGNALFAREILDSLITAWKKEEGQGVRL